MDYSYLLDDANLQYEDLLGFPELNLSIPCEKTSYDTSLSEEFTVTFQTFRNKVFK